MQYQWFLVTLVALAGYSAGEVFQCNTTEPSNGDVVQFQRQSNDGVIFDVAVYSCDSSNQYFLSSPQNTRFCVADGVWNVDEPHCERTGPQDIEFYGPGSGPETLLSPRHSLSYSASGDRVGCYITMAHSLRCHGYDDVPSSQSQILGVDTTDTGGCFLDADDGSINCWGDIKLTTLNDRTYIGMAMSELHLCAVDSSKTLRCEALCYTTETCNTYEQIVKVPLDNVDAFCVSKYQTCVIINDVVKCYGALTFEQALSTRERGTDLTCGDLSVCVLQEEGSIQCWYKEGEDVINYEPAFPQGFAATDVQIATNSQDNFAPYGISVNQYICATEFISIDEYADLYCWEHPTGSSVTQLVWSQQYCSGILVDVLGLCCIDEAGKIECIDRNVTTAMNHTDLGLYTSHFQSLSQVMTDDIFPVQNVVEVAIGASATCWLYDSRQIDCQENILVKPAISDILSPPTGLEVVSISLSSQYGCALLTNGGIYCWGTRAGYPQVGQTYYSSNSSTFFTSVTVHYDNGNPVCGLLNTQQIECLWDQNTTHLMDGSFRQLWVFDHTVCGWLLDDTILCEDNPSFNGSNTITPDVHPPTDVQYSSVFGYQESLCVRPYGIHQAVQCYPNTSTISNDPYYQDGDYAVVLPYDALKLLPNTTQLQSFQFKPHSDLGFHTHVCATTELTSTVAGEAPQGALTCYYPQNVFETITPSLIRGLSQFVVGKDQVCALKSGGVRCFGSFDVVAGGISDRFNSEDSTVLISGNETDYAADAPWCGITTWTFPCSSIAYATSRSKTSLKSGLIGPFMFTQYELSSGHYEMHEDVLLDQPGVLLWTSKKTQDIASIEMGEYAFIVDANDVKLQRLQLQGNSNVAAVRIESADNIKLWDMFFINNERAVFVKTGSDLKMKDCTLQNNGPKPGGAIITFSSTLSIDNCLFEGNNAESDEGGGILSYDSETEIVDTIFRNNAAVIGGGIYGYKADFTIEDSTFEFNTATEGAAIYTYSGTIENYNVKFDSNTATDNGGAMWTELTQLSSFGGVFTHNSAGELGGALYLDSNRYSLSLNDDVFSNNTAGLDGGGIYASTIRLTTDDVAFQHNTAGRRGGAFFAIYSTVTLNQNSTSADAGGTGGTEGGGGKDGGGKGSKRPARRLLSSISARRSPLAIASPSPHRRSLKSLPLNQRTRFESNAAIIGGAVYIFNTSLQVGPTLWTSNQVTEATGEGPDLFVNQGSVQIISEDQVQKDRTTVSASSPDHFVFVQQPFGIQTAGHALYPGIILRVEDEYGSQSSASIFVEAILSSSGGELSGTISTTCQNGICLFGADLTSSTESARNMIINGPAQKYAIQFSTTIVLYDGSTKVVTASLPVRIGSCINGEYYDTLSKQCIDCAAGKYAFNGTECIDCEAGSYSEESSTECTLAEVGAYVALSGQSQSVACESDSFALRTGSTKCRQCDWAGAECEGSFIKANNGNYLWRYTTESIRQTLHSRNSSDLVPLDDSLVDIFSCPTHLCLDNTECANNRLPYDYNLLCGQCQDGYSEWGGACVECEDTNWGFIFLFVALSWAYVMILKVVSSSSTGMTKIIFYFVQTAIFMVGSYSSILSWLGLFNFDPQSTGYCITPITPWEGFALRLLAPLILYILLGINYLIHRLVTSFQSFNEDGTGSITMWLCCDRTTKDIGAVVELDNCANVVGVRNAQFYRPEDDLSAKGRKRLERKRFRRHQEGKEPETEETPLDMGPAGFDNISYLRTATSLLLFTYTQITTTCLYFLQCLDIDDESLVFSSPSLSCDSDAYSYWLIPVIVLVIIDVLGIPILIICWIRCHREEHEHRLSRFYKSWGVLYEMYNDKSHYYEAVAILRRTLLVTLDVLLYLDSSAKFLSFMLLNFGVLCMHVLIRPFRIPIENTSEAISLICLTILSFVLSAYPPPFSTTVEVGVGLLICLPALLLLTVYGLSKYYQFRDVCWTTDEDGEESTKDEKPAFGKTNTSNRMSIFEQMFQEPSYSLSFSYRTTPSASLRNKKMNRIEPLNRALTINHNLNTNAIHDGHNNNKDHRNGPHHHSPSTGDVHLPASSFHHLSSPHADGRPQVQVSSSSTQPNEANSRDQPELLRQLSPVGDDLDKLGSFLQSNSKTHLSLAHDVDLLQAQFDSATYETNESNSGQVKRDGTNHNIESDIETAPSSSVSSSNSSQGAEISIHQDNTEADMSNPIISIQHDQEFSSSEDDG